MISSTAPGGATAPAGSGEAMVQVEDLHRTFGSGSTAVHALRGVSFTARRGELTALKGRSGSGKTTLLNLLGRSASTVRTWAAWPRRGCWRCAGTGSASSSSPSA
jgi:ABC-type glutathione transport system ATPase component